LSQEAQSVNIPDYNGNGILFHPGTTTLSTDATGLQTLTVSIYSPDVPSSPTVVGANFGQVFSNPAFTAYQQPMNLVELGFFAELAVVAPEISLYSKFLAKGLAGKIALPAGGSLTAKCMMCGVSLFSEGVNITVEQLAFRGAELKMEATAIGGALGSGLEAGENAAFTEALNATLNGSPPPPGP
jgi:hypothetical protein